jgi:hypothetical protein
MECSIEEHWAILRGVPAGAYDMIDVNKTVMASKMLIKIVNP